MIAQDRREGLLADAPHWTMLGGALWIGGLLVMGAVSARAWTKVPRGARLPMQWGPDWKPVWRARTPVALLFTPAMAALLGLALALFLRRAPVGHEAMFFWIRIAPIVILVPVHAAHIAFAVRDPSERAG